jgi:hypothetical protein
VEAGATKLQNALVKMHRTWVINLSMDFGMDLTKTQSKVQHKKKEMYLAGNLNMLLGLKKGWCTM